MSTAVVHRLDRSYHDPLQRLDVLNQFRSFPGRQAQTQHSIVVVYHCVDGRKPPVMVEPAFLTSEQSSERRRAIATVGRPVCLKIIDTDFGRGVHRPAGLGEQGRHMTPAALRAAFEDTASIFSEACIETTARGRRCWNAELIIMKRGELRCDQIWCFPYVEESSTN